MDSISWELHLWCAPFWKCSKYGHECNVTEIIHWLKTVCLERKALNFLQMFKRLQVSTRCVLVNYSSNLTINCCVFRCKLILLSCCLAWILSSVHFLINHRKTVFDWKWSSQRKIEDQTIIQESADYNSSPDRTESPLRCFIFHYRSLS